MNRIWIVTAASTLAVAGAAAGIASAASNARHVDNLRYGVGVTQIVLDNTRGQVEITAAGSAPTVAVKRTTTTLFAKAAQTAYVRDGVLHLGSRCDHTLCTVDFRIAAPAGVRLRVTNREANVSITGSPGDLQVVNTGEGQITLDLARAPRTISVRTASGDIDLTVPHGTYALSASAPEGGKRATGVSLTAEATHAIRASTAKGDVAISGR
jgi:hypothetical protein